MTTKLFGLVLAVAFPVFAQQAQQPPAPATKPAPASASPNPAQTPNAAQPSAPGQQSQPIETPDNAPVIRVGVNEVNLIFTVTDKHGHYVPNLKLNDFALLDDQRYPEKINDFRQQINLPLRVGIVIDASTSISTRFEFEQKSAVDFLLQI